MARTTATSMTNSVIALLPARRPSKTPTSPRKTSTRLIRSVLVFFWEQEWEA